MTRPFIHLNFAVDRAGRMGADDGTSLQISSAEDWCRVHQLRERSDAVAVGMATWLADRPRLDVRSSRLGRRPKRQPARVIFAGSRSCWIPEDGRRTFVVGSSAVSGGLAQLVRCRGHVLGESLAVLHESGIRSLMVEGGKTLLGSFLSQGYYDEISVFVPTGSVTEAHRVVEAALPGLPTLQGELFGEGTLLVSGLRTRDEL